MPKAGEVKDSFGRATLCAAGKSAPGWAHHADCSLTEGVTKSVFFRFYIIGVVDRGRSLTLRAAFII
jgi:hypothetical protein